MPRGKLIVNAPRLIAMGKALAHGFTKSSIVFPVCTCAHDHVARTCAHTFVRARTRMLFPARLHIRPVCVLSRSTMLPCLLLSAALPP